MEPGFMHAGCEGAVGIRVEAASQQLDLLGSGPEKRTADLPPVLHRWTQMRGACTSFPLHRSWLSSQRSTQRPAGMLPLPPISL